MRKKPSEKRQVNWPQLQFRWKNFRSFEDTGWFELRPITVILGANNSGKTNLLRPLLLLKQTVESADRDIALKITGPLADVGTYKNLVLLGKTNRAIEMGIRFHSTKEDSRPKRMKPLGQDPPNSVWLEFGMGKNPVEIELLKFEIFDEHNRRLLLRKRLPSGRYSVVSDLKLNPDFLKMMRVVRPRHFWFSPANIFRHAVRGEESRRGEKKDGRPAPDRIVKLLFSGTTPGVMDVLEYVEAHLIMVLSRLSYIGPLREYPKRFYESTEEAPAAVGARGECAPHVLYLAKSKTLVEKTNHWLKTMGLARKVSWDSFHDDLFSLKVMDINRNSEVDYSDSGFGLSQLLPIIVQGFHADPRSLLFLEQPEIHLNPKLQSSLANLFGAFAGEGKAVLVETHSEHLVLRIRTLVAEKKLKAEDVGLYFVEKKKGRSFLSRISVGQNGHIKATSWPAGFFEDSMIESLRLASLQSA